MNSIFYQTEIKGFGDFSPILDSIGENGCLAMCYLWTAGIEPSNSAQMAKYLRSAMMDGSIDGECFVNDASKLLQSFTGKKWKVTKKDISDISGIRNATPVRYDYNGHSHWVVVENGRIVFNSLVNSVCVTKGKPASARIVTKV